MAKDKPNVLLIVPDDVGWFDVGPTCPTSRNLHGLTAEHRRSAAKRDWAGKAVSEFHLP
jgi:hypothetical protein